MTKVQEGEAPGTQHLGTVGRYRWAVDISHWNPEEEELEFLCSEILREDERKQCMRFKFLEDRKRAVVSKLLQRHASSSIAGFVGSMVEGNGVYTYVEDMNTVYNCASAVDLRQVELGKTKGRKPFLASHELHPGSKGWDLVPNFNFSVSHEGRYVVLASESHCICGCDVASPQSLRAKGDALSLEKLKEKLKAFEKQLTRKEWDDVYEMKGLEEERILCRHIENTFSKYWSLKEAYVKAIGMGLGYDLGNVEFIIDHDANIAKVKIEGQSPSDDWSFVLHELAGDHWVAVARGPIDTVVDAYGEFKKTFRKPDMEKSEVRRHVQEEKEPVFRLLSVYDLVPQDLKGEYETAGGDAFL